MYTMQKVSASRISLFLGRIAEDHTPVIKMMIDEDEWLMLTVKRNPMAAGMVEQLAQSPFEVGAITGVAFEYKESVKQSSLVVFPDPTITGVYVRIGDFGKVRTLFNR